MCPKDPQGDTARSLGPQTLSRLMKNASLGSRERVAGGIEAPLDADSEEAAPWVAPDGPLAPPVRAFHPQPAGTAPGDDGGGMSLAMRTRLYAARAISAQRPLRATPQ